MAKKSLPDPELLRKLLRYDLETGKLFWRQRPRELFPSDWSHGMWNSRYAETEAFTSVSSQGYLHGRIFAGFYKAHRVIWAIFYGRWPSKKIDHINGNPSDNRISNLRDVSQNENCRNQRIAKNNKSGVIGVHWHKGTGKWAAQININGKQTHIGLYGSVSKAADARDAAEREHSYHPNHGR